MEPMCGKCGKVMTPEDSRIHPEYFLHDACLPDELVPDDFDERRFAMMAGHVRTIAETMLKEFFGERCPDFEPDCECCKRWKWLDELTVNPFAE